jgi:hypothetical protein
MKSFARRNGITFLLFILVFIVGVSLISRIGPAWDEPDNIFSGGQYWNYVKSGLNQKIFNSRDLTASYFSDVIFTQDPTTARYPPVPNVIGTAVALLGERLGLAHTAATIITEFHFVSVLFFALLVATVFKFGGLLGLGIWESVFAALLCALYPTMFGHGLSDLKDAAQVSLFTVSLYLLVKGTLKKIPHNVVLGAVVWGFALATKFNAIYVPIIWFLWRITDCRHARDKKVLISIFTSLFLILLIGFITMFIAWPYLWNQPIAHMVEVVTYFTSVGQGYRVFWNGVLYQVGVGKSLWWYPWANVLVVTPPLLLVAIGIGIGRWILSIVTKRKEACTILLLVFWIGVPLARSILPTAAFYDGLRHFIEVLPPLFLFAAFGLSRVSVSGIRMACIVLAIGVLGHLAYIDYTYFPYSSGYFNMFAGNPNVRFDRDIEALSVHEAVGYVHAAYGRVRIWVPIGGHLSWYYLTSGDQYVYSESDADTIVLVNKSSHSSQKEFAATIANTYQLTHTISRGNAIFAWIYRKL